ncbi:sugar phosphate isomerase/epimerase family protein [Streptosporangium sp. NPDC000563]|uniref:sugar phosphate isomerase/epimerase family protein n=1 Tax=Streptosporangium sp. NPDC000563 TaxID=3154366 RepID=UPI003320BB80
MELTDFVAIAAAAGFPAIELSIQQVQAHRPHRVRNLLSAHKLTVAAASGILPAGPVLPHPLLVDDATYTACLAGLGERLEAFAEINCPVATIVFNPRTALEPQAAMDIAADRLAVLADAAAQHGVALAVEAVSIRTGLDTTLDGPHRLVSSIAELTTLLQHVGRDNLTLLVDSFHWAANGAPAEHITALAPGAGGTVRIGHVQIADIPFGEAPEHLTDAMRQFPGEGAAPWDLLEEALTKAGYHGAVSVELFNPALRALPVKEIVSRALNGARHCWSTAEVSP